MPQIYEVIKQEHEQVSQMLTELTEGRPTKKKIDQLYAMYEAHIKAEEKTFYQDLQANKQTKDIVLEGIEEHHVSDVILREIRKLEPGDERTKAKLSVLKETIEHHVQEEEQEMFPKAQQVKDGQWAEQMAQQFEKQEQTIKKRLQ